MTDAFDGILGQPQVREFLRATVAHNKVSHAYLFSGPSGSNKTMAAFAFAQAILCPQCHGPQRKTVSSECETCKKVMRKKHPDVHYYAPEGAQGYLVAQIRDLVSDTALAPIQAQKKVYIIDRADMLGTQSANAFLKTLEEPPADVVIILLARTQESVLPTILSRCQVVPFRTIPATEAMGIIAQNTGASVAEARMAIEACNGSITRAIEFVNSSERMAFRKRITEIMAALERADDWDILEFAHEMVLLSKAPLDVVRAEQEQELAENADFLAKSALRQIEARNKRQLTAKTLESLHHLTSIVRSWLRDVLMVCAQTPELMVNIDEKIALEQAAFATDEARVAAALACVDRCDDSISYNVSPETCLDALFLEVRNCLYTPQRAVACSRHFY